MIYFVLKMKHDVDKFLLKKEYMIPDKCSPQYCCKMLYTGLFSPRIIFHPSTLNKKKILPRLEFAQTKLC